MKPKNSKICSTNVEVATQTIREKAELILFGHTTLFIQDFSPEKIQELVHELQVHQIELEIQNEELQEKKAELTTEKERYFDLYELAPVGYCTLSKEGEILQANLATTVLFETSKSDLIYHSFNQFIFHEDQDIYYYHQQRLLATHFAQTCEIRIITGNGKKIWVQLDSSLSKDIKNGSNINVIFHDITQRKNAQSELAIAAIAFESQNGIIITDSNGIILRTNKAFTQITGFTSEDVIGRNTAFLKSGPQGKQFYEHMWTTLKNQGNWLGEILNKHKNGEIYTELLSITAVYDEKSQITHYVANFSDITENKEAEAAIHRLAYYDALTGLPNRRLLQDRISQAIIASARREVYGAILFIDVDHFKTLNDTHGHSSGDLLLVDIAQRLRANIRLSDTVGRQGGDEFIILLDNLSNVMTEAAGMAQLTAEQLRHAMEKPFNLNGIEYTCQISIGVSLFSKDDTIEDLLKQADLALYKAKDEGRNTIRFFDPVMQERFNLRITLESELKIAILQEQFYLYYQPQVNSNGYIESVEALIRWQHPQRGLISPDEFIPIADETGLILAIGKWVMETACSQLKKWEKNSHTNTIKIAVNISAREFWQTDYVAQVDNIIKTSSINPTLLELELTESIVVENMEDSINKMNALKQLGLTFSIDDFGTGFSSLSYLTRLPFNQLKIDKSFVNHIPGIKNDEMIIRAIITMAKGLEMNVIAEGVETLSQQEFLEANGCTIYQGYLFSRPLPITTLEEFLKKNL